jgi:hypothetical protein
VSVGGGVRADGGVEEAAATLTEKLAALTAAGTRVLIIHGAQDRLVRDPPLPPPPFFLRGRSACLAAFVEVLRGRNVYDSGRSGSTVR